MPFPPSGNDPTVPSKPVVKVFPTPDLRDRVFLERIDSRKGGFVLPEKGAPYEGRDPERMQGFVFATAAPTDTLGWLDLFWLNQRLNEDAYNYSLDYPWVSKDYPRVTRTYVTLRSEWAEPVAGTPDSAYGNLRMVDYKIGRIEDPILDSLFVSRAVVFERIPAPVGFAAERESSVLPYAFRVAVPGQTTSSVEIGPALPPVLGKGDWSIVEKTTSAFRKTVDQIRRILPPEGVTLVGKKLTRDKQVAAVTRTWKEGDQEIDARPTLIEAEVDIVGDGTTIKSETEVTEVFPASKFSLETSDPVPEEFRDLLPVRTTAHSSAGLAAPPVLGVTDLSITEEQADAEIKRRTVVDRDASKLPAVLKDYELGGIQAQGSEFGGVMETIRSLSDKPQEIEQGFDITEASVRQIGNKGLSVKSTTRLFTGGFGGPFLELTDGGGGYVDEPAVVFDVVSGSGSGATGVASVSDAGGSDLDAGGTFARTFASNGDTNGAFYFLGERYNEGVWGNPSRDGGPVKITAKTQAGGLNPQLKQSIDRDDTTDSFIQTDNTDGKGYITYDLGIGRALKPNYINIRWRYATPNATVAEKYKVFAHNKADASDIVRIGDTADIPRLDVWQGRTLTATKGYRYLRIEGTDLELTGFNRIYRNLHFNEVEFYGELTIKPALQLDFVYDGDETGVFFYLGKRAGGGTWTNPQTSGDISITAPYDTLANGTFDSMVDRAPSNTYLADRLHAEVWFDLGAGRALQLETLLYQNRADFSSRCRFFSIQGSNDGVTWSSSQRSPVGFQAAEWTKVTITNEAFATPYRFFRIIIPSDKEFLAVGEIELYGALQLSTADVTGNNLSVTGVTVTAPGAGYAEPPVVVFDGGGGTGAAGNAVLNLDGGVESVTMTASGSGYSTAPTVAFSIPGRGSGATAQATLVGGVVTAIAVLTPGSGFDQVPRVKIVSATGSGAAATAVLNGAGEVDSIIVTNGGSDYALVPTAVVQAAGDPEADAEIGFDIAGVTLTNGGSDYTSPPLVHVNGSGESARIDAILGFGVLSVLMTEGGDGYTSVPTPVFTGNGTGAAGTATIVKGLAAGVVTNPGSGYLSAPEVRVSSGNAQFTAVLGYPLSHLGLVAKGTGYTSNPTVTITGDGTGATASAVRSFSLESIQVTAGGAGYAEPPAVVISAPTGNNPIVATATAVLTSGVVTSIVVNTVGNGFLTAPTITMTGSATATSTLAAGGAVDSLVLDAAGSAYSVAAVSITGGGGTGARGAAVLNTEAGGVVRRVDLVNEGGGYSTVPTLSIPDGTSGGTGATATTSLSAAGRVASVSITAAGQDYSGSVELSFTGGGGTGAAGSVVLRPAGSVKALSLVSGGDGFGDDSEITFSGGGGTGAAATVTKGACGIVVSVKLTSPGGPFSVAPLVQFVGGFEAGGGGGLVQTGDMAFGRTEHTATLLPNGKVLVTGGYSTAVDDDTAELFDPTTELWTATGTMVAETAGHRALLLSTGKVLTVGGYGNSTQAALYTISTGTWAATDPLDVGFDQEFPTLTLLPDGRALIAGGYGYDQRAARFDPATETWTYTGNCAFPRTEHTATLLPNGKVLVVGGAGSPTTAELYDPAAGTWTATGSTAFAHRVHAAVLLPNGKVLVSGSYGQGVVADKSAEIYDPALETWSTVASMNVARGYFSMALTSDGRALVAGGTDGTDPVGDIEVYDPDANTWELITGLTARNTFPISPLADGRLLLIGGSSAGGYLNDAYIFSVGGGCTPETATALYRLGSSWPTLIEEQTDPTEGIRLTLTKKIVPARTPLPAGFAESFPLDIYRSIQIVTKVDLHTLPPPETWRTSQNITFPPQLLSVYPIWDQALAQGTENGFTAGVPHGSVSAEAEVNGSFVILKQGGFQGAAIGRVERQFFGNLTDTEAASFIIIPTIIRTSSGTAIIRGDKQVSKSTGATYDQTPILNTAGEPAKPGDALPNGGFYSGNIGDRNDIKASGSSGTRTEVADITNVLTPGFNIASTYDAKNTSSAGALSTSVGATGTFTVVIPASNPTILVPGGTVLTQVNVEKWRFGVFVRTLVYLEVPLI